MGFMRLMYDVYDLAGSPAKISCFYTGLKFFPSFFSKIRLKFMGSGGKLLLDSWRSQTAKLFRQLKRSAGVKKCSSSVFSRVY